MNNNLQVKMNQVLTCVIRNVSFALISTILMSVGISAMVIRGSIALQTLYITCVVCLFIHLALSFTGYISSKVREVSSESDSFLIMLLYATLYSMVLSVLFFTALNANIFAALYCIVPALTISGIMIGIASIYEIPVEYVKMAYQWMWARLVYGIVLLLAMLFFGYSFMSSQGFLIIDQIYCIVSIASSLVLLGYAVNLAVNSDDLVIKYDSPRVVATILSINIFLLLMDIIILIIRMYANSNNRRR